VKHNDRRVVRVCAAAVASRFEVSCSQRKFLVVCDVVKATRKVDLTRQSVLFVVLSICGAPLYTFVLFLPSSDTYGVALAVDGHHAME
jgi:hypothetical protein